MTKKIYTNEALIISYHRIKKKILTKKGKILKVYNAATPNNQTTLIPCQISKFPTITPSKLLQTTITTTNYHQHQTTNCFLGYGTQPGGGEEEGGQTRTVLAQILQTGLCGLIDKEKTQGREGGREGEEDG